MIKRIKNLTKSEAVNICVYSASVFLYFILFRFHNYVFNFNLTEIESTSLYSVSYVFCFYFLKKLFVKIFKNK